MSEKDNTKTLENAKTLIKVSVSEVDAHDILAQLGVPVPNEMPEEIHLIISPPTENYV